ncbi:MAG: hypothetical protein ACJAQT_004392 [Akkermansiaceae bacterium]|jgi:hypothetical protein
MTILAFQSGDWAVITIAIIVFGCVIGGMVKFYQAIQILRRGKPKIDREVALEQEQELKNNEQDD